MIKDVQRISAYHHIPFRMNDIFPLNTLTIQRLLTLLHDSLPPTQYEACIEALWTAYFVNNINLGQEEALLACVMPFTNNANPMNKMDEKIKEQLKRTTEMVTEAGAFGAPFFLVRNERGEEDMFFGSDRFHHMAAFLQIPFELSMTFPLSKL